jgi:predicted enzyme related to lactoylglutathione lyase
MTQHPIVHVEIPSHDLTQSSRFYADLFGWAVEPVPGMDYALFRAEGGPGGGFPPVDSELHSPGAILIYVGTDDIDASLAKAEALGGTTIVSRTEIPAVGWFAVFNDPSGNRVALFTSLAS